MDYNNHRVFIYSDLYTIKSNWWFLSCNIHLWLFCLLVPNNVLSFLPTNVKNNVRSAQLYISYWCNLLWRFWIQTFQEEPEEPELHLYSKIWFVEITITVESLEYRHTRNSIAKVKINRSIIITIIIAWVVSKIYISVVVACWVGVVIVHVVVEETTKAVVLWILVEEAAVAFAERQ